jgi:hypothetical protein
VKGPDILHELGAAAQRRQRLSIKIEIDRNPPAGAQCETTAVTVPRLIAVRHHDLPSLMAGKINAVLSRAYAKGRDWYDLLWYLTKKIEPNLVLLEHGLKQTPSSCCGAADAWPSGVLARLDTLNWDELVQDVRPFLEDREERSVFTPDILRAMLGKAVGSRGS